MRYKAQVLTNLAQLQAPEEAINTYSEASHLFRTSHDAYGEGIALFNIGVQYHQLGDERDKEYASRALEILEALHAPEAQRIKEMLGNSGSSA